MKIRLIFRNSFCWVHNKITTHENSLQHEAIIMRASLLTGHKLRNMTPIHSPSPKNVKKQSHNYQLKTARSHQN